MRTYLLQRCTPLLLVLLLLTGFVTAFTPTPAQANTVFDSSYISQVAVDPTDNSVWVLWFDSSTIGQQISIISHFDAQGRLLKRQTINGLMFGYGSFVLLPNSPRFYGQPKSYERYEAPIYQDLTTGQIVKVTAPDPLPVCNAATYNRTYRGSTLVYNPVAQHLYFNCAEVGKNQSLSYVVDVKTNTFAGTLPYVITAYNPVNQQLYAALEHTSSNPNISYPVLSLVALTASNELPIPQGGLGDVGILGFINSAHVNTKTGQTFIAAAFCYAKCTGPLMYVFDKNNQRIQPSGGNTVLASYYTAVNETTNQLYGPRDGNLNREDVAVDANKTNGSELAGFYWSVLAVDQKRNLAYAVERNYVIFESKYERGLTLLVMDGKNYDIVRYINLRGPGTDLSVARPLAGPPANFQGYYFSETGHTLEGKFLQYWLNNGGLAQFGYPLTQPFEEYNPDSNKIFTVQYFERNRFELHPENAGTPFEVELGLLGRSFSSRTGVFPIGSSYNSGETEPVEGGVRFKETGHTLTGKFYAYWQAHGGLAQFGLPLTEPFQEVSPTDGQTYTVQYFERNRFELHPELAGTPYEVLLGLLGQQLLKARGWPV